jgi:hypothetical protein
MIVDKFTIIIIHRTSRQRQQEAQRQNQRNRPSQDAGPPDRKRTREHGLLLFEEKAPGRIEPFIRGPVEKTPDWQFGFFL